jgi:hypothetical protein
MYDAGAMSTPRQRPETGQQHGSRESKVRDAKSSSLATGGTGSGGQIGEVPQSRRYKIVIGVIVLLLVLLALSELWD